MITLAKTAGFCFGVNRAINMVYDLMQEGKSAVTLGPIIHNPQIVGDLKERGVCPIDDPHDAPSGSTVVIRSHGARREDMQILSDMGVSVADATCPFVKKLHRLAEDTAKDGRVFILCGDATHPEVEGIVSDCDGEYHVISNAGELEKLLGERPDLRDRPVTMASQTTFSMKEWENCSETLKKLCTNAVFFATICSATAKRQEEAEELARKSDYMVVIGGRQSSNTAKLRDICSRFCPTVLIERAEELPAFPPGTNIGVTAGASTPASIIKEVLSKMNENTGSENFEEMLEESLKSFNTDEKVHGVVVGISPTEVYVEVGRKQAGVIPLNELSNDPSAKPEDLVKIGDEFDLLIMKTNDQEGTIMLSKRRVDAMKNWDDLEKFKESGEVLTGKVTEIVKGGVVVVREGVRIFVPASQATLMRDEPLEPLKDQEVRFRLIEVNRNRRRAIGSIRSVLKDDRREARDRFWEQVEEGQHYTGKVKSITNFGAFVDLGGVDGLIHISELSWTRVKHPSEVLSVGDTVEVYIKKVDKEAGRISLGYRKDEDNPWERMGREFPVGTVCKVKIVGITTFGAFANVLPGIDGLIHISQLSDHRVEKPQDVVKVGDEVIVKVTDIDFDRHRVSLSIREVLEDEGRLLEPTAPKEPVVPVKTPEDEKEVAEETTETDVPAEETASGEIPEPATDAGEEPEETPVTE